MCECVRVVCQRTELIYKWRMSEGNRKGDSCCHWLAASCPRKLGVRSHTHHTTPASTGCPSLLVAISMSPCCSGRPLVGAPSPQKEGIEGDRSARRPRRRQRRLGGEAEGGNPCSIFSISPPGPRRAAALWWWPALPPLFTYQGNEAGLLTAAASPLVCMHEWAYQVGRGPTFGGEATCELRGCLPAAPTSSRWVNM